MKKQDYSLVVLYNMAPGSRRARNQEGSDSMNDLSTILTRLEQLEQCL